MAPLTPVILVRTEVWRSRTNTVNMKESLVLQSTDHYLNLTFPHVMLRWSDRKSGQVYIAQETVAVWICLFRLSMQFQAGNTHVDDSLCCKLWKTQYGQVNNECDIRWRGSLIRYRFLAVNFKVKNVFGPVQGRQPLSESLWVWLSGCDWKGDEEW